MTLDGGFEVCVVGKPGESSAKAFGITGSGPSGRLAYREVTWWEGPTTVEDLPEEVLRRVAGSAPLLITASLREAISARSEFIIEVLGRRPKNAETIMLACENAPHQDYEQVRGACSQAGALMLDTVVNRMCLALENDREGRRMVSAHRLAEWLVQRPGGSPLPAILRALAAVNGFEVVGDIDARLARKLWMVNGAHQGLALMARRANAEGRLESADDLRQALHDPQIAARLGHIHNAMNEALRIAHPGMSDSIRYGMEHVRAYAEHPDSVARVLKALRRLELIPFLDALDERIAAPARICAAGHRSVEPFTHVIDVFLELAANIDAFEDNILARNTPISVSDDIEVVERFRAMLSGWAADIDKQTGHFARLLADHREAYES
jgi:hypothetical protein